jgi:WD40 repeat protein
MGVRTVALFAILVSVARAEPPKEVKTLVPKQLVPFAKMDEPLEGIAWLPDGTGVVSLSATGIVRVWDVASSKELSTLNTTEKVSQPKLAVSRDGKLIAVSLPSVGIRIWDRVTNRIETVPEKSIFPDQINLDEGSERVGELRFTDDSTTIQVVTTKYTILRFSVEGKAIPPRQAMPEQFGQGEQAYIRSEAAVSPRAGLGVAYYEGHEVDELRTWDFAKQKIVASVRLKDSTRPIAHAIDPCGRWAAISDRMRAGVVISKLQIIDTATLLDGRVIDLPVFAESSQHEVATRFSADGRLITIYRGNPLTNLYDVATGSLLGIVEGKLQTQSFSPGGRLFANRKGTAIAIYDMTQFLPPNPANEWDAEASWKEIVSPDGRVGLRAMYQLADHPEVALKRFEEQLKPSTRPTAEEVASWIQKLDAPAFAERSAALKKLATVADALLPELRKEVAENPSPEVVKSLSGILETSELSRRKLQGEYLRAYRVVQVLETIGPKGKPLLKSYAAGAKAAFLTQEAEWALSRMP